LLSLAAIRDGGLPRWLAYFGILVVVGDWLTLFGVLLGALLMTIWFLAVGFVLWTGGASSSERTS
jgi:hypothetical protein